MNDYEAHPNQKLNTTSSPTFAGLTINGAATFAATVTATGQFLAGDGSAAAPSYSFSASPTTGFYLSAANVIGVSTAGTARWAFNASGHFLAAADNTYDVGASGATRPRTGYFGTSVNTPLVTGGSVNLELTSANGATTQVAVSCAFNAIGSVCLGSGSAVGSSNPSGLVFVNQGTPKVIVSSVGLGFSTAGSVDRNTSGDAIVAALASASLRLGSAPSATPVAQTFTIGEASRPGTDTDVGGANGTIRSGLGTGTGTPSTVKIQGAVVAASGSTAQTYGTFIEGSGTTLGFYGVTPIARAVLATGAGRTVDDVITALQNLGLVKQS